MATWEAVNVMAYQKGHMVITVGTLKPMEILRSVQIDGIH